MTGTVAWIVTDDTDGWEVYVTNPAGGYRVAGCQGGTAVVDALPAEATPLVPASSLPDPTTPEALRYAADVLIALSGDNRIPADSAWTGRVLQHEAELREKDIAAAAKSDAEVEELAQIIFEAAGYSEHGDPERNAARAALNWMRSR